MPETLQYRSRPARVLVHVADRPRCQAIHASLRSAGWQIAEVDDREPPDVLLLQAGDCPAPLQALAEAHTNSVVLLLVDAFTPDTLQLARRLRASAVLASSTPAAELPLVLAAHHRR